MHANELLANLQAQRERPLPSYERGQWVDVLKDQVRQDGSEPKGLGHVVGNKWQQFRTLLTADEMRRIGANFAVGVISSPELNAFIVRQHDALALIVNWGLMILFHEDLRLSIACKDPQQVEFVEGLDRSEISAEKLAGLYDGFRQSIREGNGPKAPYVRLTKSAELLHALGLDLYEAFIIAHELGHIINGDLIRNDAFAVSPKFPGVDVFRENVSHTMELNADAKGFELLLRVNNARKGGLTGEGFTFLSVVALFDLLALTISPNESDTHPSPVGRILNISRRSYGEEFATKMERSYDDGRLIHQLIETYFNES